MRIQQHRRHKGLYPIPVRATHGRDSQGAWDVIHRGKPVGVCHGSGSRASGGLRGGATARAGEALCGRRSDATVLALAAIYEGGARTEAAKIGGVGLQTVRDWVLAFNAEGAGALIHGTAPCTA